jgi:CHAT domain-containing protein
VDLFGVPELAQFCYNLQDTCIQVFIINQEIIMVMKRLNFVSLGLVVLTLLSSGCLSAMLPRENSLAIEGRYPELEEYMEPRVRATPKPSFDQLWYLCQSYSSLKKYNKLFPCLSQMEERVREGDSIASLTDLSSFPVTTRATALMELGQYNKAVEQAEIGYQFVVKRSLSRYSEVQALATLGLAYALNQQKAKAEETTTLLANLYTGYPHGLQKPAQQAGLARIYLALKRYDDAVKVTSQTDFVGGFTNSMSMVVTSGLGLLSPDWWEQMFAALELPARFMKYKSLFQIGNIKEAKEGFDDLLKHHQSRGNGEVYWQILADRGRIAIQEKQYGQAIQFLIKSIDVIEQQRSTINTEISKIGFVGDKQMVYEDLVSTLVRQKQFDKAFSYAERAKARALVDLLASKKQFTIAQESKGNQVTQLLNSHHQSEMGSVVQDYRVTQEQQTKTRNVIVTQVKAIAQAAPELASLITVSVPDVKELQQLLPEDETLIEYYGSGDSIYAFLLNVNGVRGVKLDGKGLAESVTQYRDALIKPGSDQHKSLGADLYQRLIAPLVSGVKTQNLTIVPHGILHYLPFNALHTGSEFVIDKYNIRLLPSASVMKFLKKNQKGQKKSLLALGNPDLGDPRMDLPGAQAEAIAIAGKINGAKVLVRGKATETAVKQNGADFRYLHLASHGTFDPENPLTSALLLAKDSFNDGSLTVVELYDLRLNADLVTLSACETALGKVANGDDVVGFTRGFLYAGASSIVSSLWKVHDEATSVLMQMFYKNLQSSNKRKALRQAQLKLKAGKYSHPAYWAAFQLTGSVD